MKSPENIYRRDVAQSNTKTQFMNDAATSLVSVVIPTYNHGRYLGRALKSVLDQTYTNWEAIVIDNHSTDNTDEVMASFSDSRISYLKINNNGLIAASRNTGIQAAKGEWIAFLDSDDTWYPEKLKWCINCLENGADLVAHGLKIIGESSGFIYCGPKHRATFNSLLEKGTCITISATVIRKSVLDGVGNFSENAAINTSEDYHLWIKLARENVSMRFTNEILGEYRVHAANNSGAVVHNMYAALRVIDEFLPVATSAGFASRLRARRCRALPYYGAARFIYKTKCYSGAWPFFIKSILLWPFQIRIYAAIGVNAFYQLTSKLKVIVVEHNKL